MMHTNAKHYRRRTARLLVVGLCMVAAFALAQAIQAPAQMQAPFASSAPSQQYRSAAERSELVLQDIAATLKRIESRLAVIERATVEAASALRAGRREQGEQ